MAVVTLVESFKNGAGIQCLADQVLLLRIEKVRDELAVVAHRGGPKIHDFAEIQRRIARGKFLEPRRAALRFAGRMVEEKREHERANSAGLLSVAHALLVFDEGLHELNGHAIE